MYLLCGLDFKTVQILLRWSSDAFLLYLRKHTEIMAPYLQENPVFHAEVLRSSLPPVR